MRKTGFAFASFLALGLLPGPPQGGLGSDGAGLFGKAALAASGDTLVVTSDGVNVRFGPSTNARVKLRVYRDQQVMELQREGEWVRAEIAGSGGQDGWIHGSLLVRPDGERPAAAAARAQAAAPAAPPPATRGAVAGPTAKPAASTAGVPTAPGEVAVVGPGGALPSSALAARTQPPSGAPQTPDPAAIEPAAGPAQSSAAAEVARFRQSVDYLNSRAVAVAGVDLFGDVKEAGGGVVQVAATEAWSTIPPGGQQSYANTLLDRWAAARGAGGPVSVQIVAPDGQVLLERARP